MSRFDQKGRLVIPDDETIGAVGPPPVAPDRERGLLLARLFCQKGHPLIEPQNPRFDGEPGIRLLCEGAAGRQLVFLSPFYGDERKTHEAGFEPGEILIVRCPTCEAELSRLAPHDCRPGAMYVCLFLDAIPDVNNSACVCNAWGCYASFLRLSGEVIAGLYTKQIVP